MKSIIAFLLLLWPICLLQTTVARAAVQQTEVRGTVTDSTGTLLSGVSVKVKNQSEIGTSTDVNGRYILAVPEGSVLVFSMVGYTAQEIPVEQHAVLDVTLALEQSDIDEVVVVAFGRQKKKDVVGAVTTVNPSQLKIPSSNLTAALAGNVAGIIAYQRNGEPGQDNADFFVRGITTFGANTNPLILIDNIELTTTDLARLQPDDIASFSVMKDATATALYGARGANGVILVTTKQGTVGPAKVSFRIENSVSAPTRKVELADPITYMRLANEAVLTRDPLGELPYSQEKIESTAAGYDPIRYPTNDWMSMLMKNYATTQRANLSVSGGGGVARYYVAGSLNKDNGILNVDKRNNFNNNIDNKSYTLRSTVNIDLSKTTELIVRLSGVFDDYSGPLNGGTETYQMIMHSNPVRFPAYYPLDAEHQHVNHIMFGNDDNEFVNPYAEMVRGYKDKSRSQLLAQLEMKQNLSFLTEGLNVNGLLNISRLSQFSVNRFYNPYYYQMGSYDMATGNYSLIQTNDGTEYLDYAEINPDKVTNSTFYFQGIANYSRLFGNKHNLSGLFVFMAQQALNANTGELQLSLPSRNLGLSGRATYSYDDRYFGEFNFGYNGSERFHESRRFGFFPSAGVAWMASNERFMEPFLNTISKLKFRFSYGLVGNDRIGRAEDRFFYLSQVDMGNAGRGATFGEEFSEFLPGVLINRYANPEIGWETARKADYAVELSLWNKLNIIADYFTEYRSNILMPRASIPTTMGLTAPVRANLGEASGKGIDFSLDYTQNFSSDLWAAARVNFTYATSKYEVYEEPVYLEPWRYHVGRPLSQTYGYIAERLFVDDAEAANSPVQEVGNSLYGGGDIKYTDVNKDGRVNSLDIVPIGNPTVPEIVYGFAFSLGYKNFDLSAMFQGITNESFWIEVNSRKPNQEWLNSTTPFYRETQLLQVYADSHWSEENRNIYALWPRLSTTINENNVVPNTWFMRDGTFLRLKQLEIGYNLSQDLIERLRLSNFRVYLSGTNLLTFSKFKLWDVEMAGNGLAYPIQRVFNLGINMSFN
ncbi:SusC/RagA family TonB-linked outer membrane protein [Parapedobacter tibetensis]|uniref:SusC/RagA family TonB-linked outer membrane protein n=1 Tax=Parapedobacter tibetensis TaxID=2972951 RepID=UPI00214DA213|nr:TonB-dependent receptor [Parapedobacter tibetensis]